MFTTEIVFELLFELVDFEFIEIAIEYDGLLKINYALQAM